MTISRQQIRCLVFFVTIVSASVASCFAEQPVRGIDGYVGSEVCQGCHTKTYHAWRSTRHAYSVLTASEARQAGYPLPQRARGQKAPNTMSWADVSYVIGGRQRITYVDRKGLVQGSSYHHRLGRWNGFPSDYMQSCIRCHFTGVGQGNPHPDDPVVPGKWIERNIGCESCHGPGERHVHTMDKADIIVDVSSRACGTCHTNVGRSLPQDDLHDTHDLVQVWNRDPHVRGVRFHSHNAFCSTCHSPRDGDFIDDHAGGGQTVFSESKQNITCVGCHNPHATTNSHYDRHKVSLDAPRPPPRSAYRGHDDDITTIDYKELETTEQSCIECHRGADRIDLDHAHATCNDCHNTFHRNRGRESRVFHDVNHRRLSCRPCHQDADHLMAILHGDADFLAPSIIHNLRKLPAAVVKRYEFRYPQLRPTAIPALPKDPVELSYPEAMDEVEQGDASFKKSELSTTSMLDRNPHRQLATDVPLQAANVALRSNPRSLPHYLTLVYAYGKTGEYSAARDLLQHLIIVDSEIFRPFFMFTGSPPEKSTEDDEPANFRKVNEPRAAVTHVWMIGIEAMAKGRFDIAEKAFRNAGAAEPNNESLVFYLALAKMGQRDYQETIQILESLLQRQPNHAAARLALGAILIQMQRAGLAIEQLEEAAALAPASTTVRYFLARAYLRGADPKKAAAELRRVVLADPEDLTAQFHLARAYRRAKFYGAATDVYQDIIKQKPGFYEARHELADVYKMMSDKLAFQIRSHEETAPPPGIRTSRWRRHIEQMRDRSKEFAQRALSEYVAALEIRPGEFDDMTQVSNIYRRDSRFTEAASSVEWLSQNRIQEWRDWYHLGSIRVQQGRYEDAVHYLRQAVATDKLQSDPYVALGLVYAKLGQLDKAVATFESGAIYEPFNPALYTNLGAAYANRGDLKRAREVLARSLELSTFPLPRVHLTHTNLAGVSWLEGNAAKAIAALRRALHAYPNYDPAKRMLAAIEEGNLPRQSKAALAGDSSELFVYNELLEVFGEVTTTAFGNE